VDGHYPNKLGTLLTDRAELIVWLDSVEPLPAPQTTPAAARGSHLSRDGEGYLDACPRCSRVRIVGDAPFRRCALRGPLRTWLRAPSPPCDQP
jgi:hypothetical protein